MIPRDLRYSKDHLWVRMEGGGTTVIGVTDYAQDAMGSVTFVEMPSDGTKVERNGPLGVIESIKAATEICSPLEGVVACINDSLNATPELINRDPYGLGWICRLKNCDTSGLDCLMDAVQYEVFVAQ
jgi:glycine cleavage system H protein